MKDLTYKETEKRINRIPEDREDQPSNARRIFDITEDRIPFNNKAKECIDSPAYGYCNDIIRISEIDRMQENKDQVNNNTDHRKDLRSEKKLIDPQRIFNCLKMGILIVIKIDGFDWDPCGTDPLLFRDQKDIHFPVIFFARNRKHPFPVVDGKTPKAGLVIRQVVIVRKRKKKAGNRVTDLGF